MRRSRLAGWVNLILSGLLVLGVWGLLTLLSARPAFKVLWDLSPQARFSVSPATEELMARLLEGGLKVEFHTLFEPLPAPQNEEQSHFAEINRRLQELTADLLRQYDYLGGDAVLVRHHDVRTDLTAIRELLKGTQRNELNFVVVRVGERSKIVRLWDDIGEIDDPRSSPAAQQLPGGTPQLPILKNFRGEEALTAAVQALLLQGQPVVYFLTGYREGELDSSSGLGYSSLKQALTGDGFIIRMLNLESERRIPDDAELIVLLEPRREMTDESAQVLAGWVRGGGRLFINVSYYPVPEWNPTLDHLGRLLGFEVGTDLLCQLQPDPFNPGSAGVDGVSQVQNLAIFNVNPTHPITRPLRQAEYPVRLSVARELSRREGAAQDLRVDESLLRSDPRTWVEMRELNGEVDLFAPRSPRGEYLAAAFRPRSVGVVIDVDAEGGGTGQVVLISGAALINNYFALNSDFGLNIFNDLVERPVSVSVRGRAYQVRELQLVPQQLVRIAWFLVGGVPISLLLVGIGVFWRRSRY